ncbi:MAG: cytochrome P450 [Planctomycetota bacterium]|nr:MAG: cytochrome P450 [Planctomycetota bacterium]
MNSGRLPPGPRRPPLAQTWWWLRDPLGFLEAMAARYGHGTPFTMRRVGGMRLVMVSDPVHVREVFQRHEVFLAGEAQKAIRTFLGPNSLIGIDGVQHKRHRRLLLPPFHGERMRAYGELMREVALSDAEGWPRGRPFRLLGPFTRITLDIIFRAVFGVHDGATRERLRRLLHELTGTGRAELAYLPFLQRDLGPWSPWGRFLRQQREFEEILTDAVRAARRAPEGREDILARLVVEGQRHADPLGDDELRDELRTLLVAGHETTTAALCWTLQWVLGLPELRREVVAEVRAASPGGRFDPARIGELKLLDACLKEGLRLHPPIPSIGRFVAREAELAGYLLPRGSYVCPVPHLTHRTPELYPDPLRFDPGRFLGAERRSPFEYYPFGGGIRLCVGTNFARYEMLVVLASLLARYDLELVGAPTLAGRRKALLVVPRTGTPVRVRERR